MKQLTGFQHGVNLGGWLSQCDYSAERLDRFITEEDFRTIAGWGLDHVRLPFDFNVVETADGSAYLEEGFARIGRAVRLALDNGAPVVGFFDSNGAYIPEGVKALAGYGKIMKASAAASSVSRVSVSVGSTISASCTISGKYIVGGCIP